MDCMTGVQAVEAAGVAWTATPWTVTSVEQQTCGQDQGNLATQRPVAEVQTYLLDLQGICACSAALWFSF